MTTKLSKETFIKLAEAYTKQENYEEELNESIISIIKKNKTYKGFARFPAFSDLIMNVVLDLLGDEFKYYFYNCSEDFNRFNKGHILADGTHLNVKDFGELWEFIHKFETEE